MKVEDGMRLGELKDSLTALHPSLTTLYPSLAFAVNGEMTKTDTVLRDGDEVSFLPPVSGGLTIGKTGRL